jgi:hypothetical protein
MQQLVYAPGVVYRRNAFAKLGAQPLIPIPKMNPDDMFRQRVKKIREEGEQYPLAGRPEYRGVRDDTGQRPPKRTKLSENVEEGGRRRKSRKSRKTRRRRHGRKTRRSRK